MRFLERSRAGLPRLEIGYEFEYDGFNEEKVMMRVIAFGYDGETRRRWADCEEIR